MVFLVITSLDPREMCQWFLKYSSQTRYIKQLLWTSCELALRWMPHNLTDDKSMTCFKYWLCAVRQQTCSNVDLDICHHLASLGHNKLITTYLACSSCCNHKLHASRGAHIHGCTGHGCSQALGTKVALYVHSYHGEGPETLSVLESRWKMSILQVPIEPFGLLYFILRVLVEKSMTLFLIDKLYELITSNARKEKTNTHMNFSDSYKRMRSQWNWNAYISNTCNITRVM